MNTVYKIEVGDREKHTVELRNNMLTGIEEILVDGKTVVKKFSMWGVDATIEVGDAEKHKVRIRYGFFQLIGRASVFTVDGAAISSVTAARDKLGMVLSAVALAVSYALGSYIGLALIVVLFVWFVLGFLYWKLGKKKVKAETSVLAALQSAYALWFLAAMLGTGQIAAVVFDFGMLAAFTVWLFLRPGKAAFAAVIIFHALVLLLNIVQILSPLDETMRPYVVLHIVLHVLSISLAVACLMAVPKAVRGSDGDMSR